MQQASGTSLAFVVICSTFCGLIACGENASPAVGSAGAAGESATGGNAGAGGLLGAAGTPAMAGTPSLGGTSQDTAGAGSGGALPIAGVAGVAGVGGSGGSGGAAPEPQVVSYDLKTDWSDTQNPNGVWSLREGDNLITPAVADWNNYRGQPAWAKSATGSGHIPVLVRIAVAGFEAPQASLGDLIVHAQDEFGGPGLGQARIVWTAPASGKVDVEGGLWMARTSLGRSDDYTLTVAGVQKATGKVAANDGHTRDAPLPLSVSSVPVKSGDVVVLQISKSAACSDNKTCAEFCGVLLTVKLTSP